MVKEAEYNESDVIIKENTECPPEYDEYGMPIDSEQARKF